ncbi:MAG: endonuclease Q family protein, partial [Candidatus Pacebacteria bacterium]|nr:endonuclease Q family protein [Candidatus Paceibacterota bacterium]
EDYSKYIYAIETGLSSDPANNWRVSMLDSISLISNSDCHSPSKLGREANVFDTELNYYSILEAIKNKDPEKFLYTIEFFPEEGKYHYDGHRNCGISFSPKQSKEHNNICPICKKPLTIGVLNRIEELADREEGQKPKKIIPFKSLIPLIEIIAEVLKVNSLSLKVKKEYEKLIKSFSNEFDILLNIKKNELNQVVSPEITQAIIQVREGRVILEPGYDGVYGKIKLFSNNNNPQKKLF